MHALPCAGPVQPWLTGQLCPSISVHVSGQEPMAKSQAHVQALNKLQAPPPPQFVWLVRLQGTLAARPPNRLPREAPGDIHPQATAEPNTHAPSFALTRSRT